MRMTKRKLNERGLKGSVDVPDTHNLRRVENK